MSTVATHVVHCDDCGEALDCGDHGHRSAKEARDLATHYGCKRRRMSDGKWYDLCSECDDGRSATIGGYDRTPPRSGGR